MNKPVAVPVVHTYPGCHLGGEHPESPPAPLVRLAAPAWIQSRQFPLPVIKRAAYGVYGWRNVPTEELGRPSPVVLEFQPPQCVESQVRTLMSRWGLPLPDLQQRRGLTLLSTNTIQRHSRDRHYLRHFLHAMRMSGRRRTVARVSQPL
jgi:hypothetical protein